MEEVFSHTIPVQIRFSDVDKVGHVNNAAYLSYVELGRMHFFKDVLERSVDWDKRGFVLARNEIDYLVPVYLADEVTCKTRLKNIGTKSITLETMLVKQTPAGPVTCARCLAVLVATDYSIMKSIEVPAEWKQRLLASANNG